MSELNINNLDELKFTSIKSVIHFKYENEHYFIQENTDETPSVSLYKGRSKYKKECIKSKYGFISNLILYKHNKKVLNSIDKINFVKKLYKAGLINTNNMYIQEIVSNENKDIETLRNIIRNAEDRLKEIIYR